VGAGLSPPINSYLQRFIRFEVNCFEVNKEIVMRKFGKSLFWVLIAVVVPGVALAETASGGGNMGAGIGAGLAIGLAGLGCGTVQGMTPGNTTAGIARLPGAAGAMFTNFILAMVLIESIAIYGFVIAFMLQGK